MNRFWLRQCPWFGGLLLAGLAAAGDASAQPRQFGVPSLPANQSIPEFARQADIQIVAPGRRLRRVVTRPVYGVLEVEQALERLLQGTHLQASRSGDGVYLIENVRWSKTAMVEAASSQGNVARAGGVDGSASSRVDLEDVVVTAARRRTERLQDVPVAVSVISSVQIERHDLATLSSLRFLAPGLSIDRATSGSGASISLRGVSSSHLDSALEQSVLIYVDGMPTSRGRILNDALFDLEAVEILKGPQALFFGKNSPGGVISVRSADPTPAFEGYVRVGHEFTNDRSLVEGAWSGPLGNGFAGRLAVHGSNSEGFMRNQAPGMVDPFRDATSGSTFIPAAPSRLGAERKFATRLTLAYDDGEAFDARLKLLYSRFAADGLQNFSEIMACGEGRARPVVVGVIDPYGDCELNNRVSKGHLADAILAAWPEVRAWARGRPAARNETVLPALTIDYDFGDDVRLTATTAWYRYAFRTAGMAGDAAPVLYWFYNKEKMRNLVQELRADTDFDGALNFSAGAFYSHTDRDFRVGGALAPDPVDPLTGRYNTHDTQYRSEARTISFFGQVRIRPFTGIEVAAGGRYTREEKDVLARTLFVHPLRAATFRPEAVPLDLETKEHNFSPEVTASWHATDEVMVYAAYRTGYLAGGFSNPGILGPAATAATLDFGKEKAKGFEVGLKFSSSDRRLTGSLVGYRYNYEGLQLTSFNAVNITFQTQNAADTRVQGIELDGVYRPVDALTLQGAIAYNDAYYRKFKGAQCYAGQTVAQGCTAGQQDLSGRRLYRAPKWVASGGARREFNLGQFMLDVGGDVQYVSKYHATLNMNPGSLQDSYWLLNAGVGLEREGSPWRVSVIGKNLTGKLYGTLGNDTPGGAGDTAATTGEPRTVAVRLEYRFF